MYMDKEVKRGYNEYLRLDEGEGKDGMMDVALLVMEIPIPSKKQTRKLPACCLTAMST